MVQIIASGTPKQVAKNKKSITGQYLSGKKSIPLPLERRVGNGRFIEIQGARENNLQNLDVRFPLGKFIAVTGVSGSGKSTLINSILKKAVAQKLNRNSEKPGKHKTVTGIEHIERLIDIDQSPIGRTPRSNPATYTGVFDDIRDLFAQTNEAKIRGYKKGRFSFNVKGGVVKLALVMVLSKLRCTFYQTFMFHVKSVMVTGIILRHLKFTIRKKTLLKF
ncbi:ATP-binding cassette domain-containing protein [Streptococcus iniae]